MNGVIATKGVASALYALRTTLEEPADRAVATALQQAQRPRAKGIRRTHHVPIHVVTAQASSDLSTNAMALVCVGQLAALARGKKSALAHGSGKDDDVGFTVEHDEHDGHEPAEGEERAHDAPERLGELREHLARLPADDLARYAGFAETAASMKHGFAIEPVSVESMPNALDQTQLRLASREVVRSLCTNGRVYAGTIVSTQVGSSKVDVIDANGAFEITSFKGLTSYLRLFANLP